MRKIITLGIMLLFIGMTISSTTGIYLERQSIKPLSFGNILYVGGNGTGNYSKIQDAIDDASDGDIVFVFCGIYHERVKLNKAIDLIGEEKTTTVIDAGGNGDAVKITANGVTIEGFTFQNSGNNYQNPDVGIEIRSDDNVITGNNIINNLIGIWLYDASQNTIFKNTVTNNDKDGIFINDYTFNNVVSGNIISNNGYAGVFLVGFMNNHHHNISGNTIISNDIGICQGGRTHENVISGNTIEKNVYNGIWLSNSHNNTISGNSIENNNLWGIELEVSSDNLISYNNFDNNYNAVFYGGNNNKWNGNYWSSRRFLPPNSLFPYPILGMRSIIINENFQFVFLWVNFDWHPASEPYDIEV